MTQEVFNAIKSSIGSSFDELKKYHENHYFELYKHDINKEKINYHAPKQKRQIEYFCEKTGKTRKKTIFDFQRYIYTEDMFKRDCESSTNINLYCNGKFKMWLKCSTDDSVKLMLFTDPYNPTDKEINTVYESFGVNYRDKLLGLCKGRGGEIIPKFDEETQNKWNDSIATYNKAVMEWCEKYGSE